MESGHLHPFVLVMITTPSLVVAQEIGHKLVEQKLAACANILPAICSIYRWEGQVNQENEVLLLVKTRTALFADQLVPAVKAMHPYQVPEIIAIPILQGLESYLDWIEQNTQ